MATLKGQALYLELVPNKDELSEDEIRRAMGWRGEGVKQVIIFPPSVDDTGREQSGIMLTRVVTSHTPRAQWDWTRLGRERIKSVSASESYNSYATTETYTREEWDLLPEATKQDSLKLELDLYLRREMYSSYNVEVEGEYQTINKQAWVVRNGKPIAVETTDEDYADLHDKSKTPQAVIRRVNKVRDSLAGFPAKLV